jgi:hypothetical protein
VTPSGSQPAGISSPVSRSISVSPAITARIRITPKHKVELSLTAGIRLQPEQRVADHVARRKGRAGPPAGPAPEPRPESRAMPHPAHANVEVSTVTTSRDRTTHARHPGRRSDRSGSAAPHRRARTPTTGHRPTRDD